MRTNDPADSPQLVEILFGAYRRQILGLLLLRSDVTFYVREIARLIWVPAGSPHRELKLLKDAGLLNRTITGNQVRYQANHDCPIYAELAGIFRKTAGLADVLRNLLTPLQDQISLALVFGSVTQGGLRAYCTSWSCGGRFAPGPAARPWSVLILHELCGYWAFV